MQLVYTPASDDPAADPFANSARARSGAATMLEASGDEGELELAGPTRHEAAAADEQARALRKKMLAVGMRNVGAFAPPAIEGGEQAARELRSELAPEPLSDDDRAFLQDVRARAKVMPNQDAYARLGVPRAATQDQIRAAYLAMVKKFHPDKAQAPKLAAALPDLEALFGGLRDAYEAIGSPEARAAYEASARSPAAGRRGPSRTEEAQLCVKKGEVHLKKRDYENALRELRRAVDLDPSPESLTALAWALANDRSQGPSGRDEALKLVARALKIDKDTARAHYVAGVLKRTTDAEAAMAHFRTAVNLDPRNGDAALELRLLERRKDKKPITGPLSRLFKRDGK
jgi:tetratricopeptide (TPR) repeat protein